MGQRLIMLRAELAVIIKHQLRRGVSNPGFRNLREPAASGGRGFGRVDNSHSAPRTSVGSARCSAQHNNLKSLFANLPWFHLTVLQPQHGSLSAKLTKNSFSRPFTFSVVAAN